MGAPALRRPTQPHRAGDPGGGRRADRGGWASRAPARRHGIHAGLGLHHPAQAQLGEPFRALEARLQTAIDARYRLPEWTPEDYPLHKRADRLAAASEAMHVVGWSRLEMRKTLGIAETPLDHDPLSPCAFALWEPWPPRVAERLFLDRFHALERAHRSELRRPEPELCPFFDLGGAEHAAS